MTRARPPSALRSRLPAAAWTEPAARNRTDLNRAWLSVWNSAAVRASAARATAPWRGGQQRDPDADQDDPDVLDAVEREQALEVVLHQRVQHAQHGGDDADHEDEEAPPLGPRAQDLEPEPDDPVDPGLDHHPRHQRRDVGRRDRVGPRQPDVERDRAGLRAEADQDEDEHDVPREGRQARPRPRRTSRSRSSRRGREDRERDDRARRSRGASWPGRGSPPGRRPRSGASRPRARPS